MERGTDGRLVAVNEAYCKLLGRSRKQLIGRRSSEFTHPDDVRASAEALASARQMPGVDCQVEKRYLRGDRQVIWVRVTEIWRPELQRVLSHVVDITETVRLAEAARAEARRSQALVAHCADLIFTVDADGRLVDANPAAQALIGWKAGAPAIGVIAAVVHPDDASRVIAALSAAGQQPGLSARIPFRLRNRDGAWVYLSAVVDNQVANPDVSAMIVTGQEVTAAVEQLRQLADHQRALVQALSRAAEFRDPYTAGHQAAVADLSSRIAVELGLAADEVAAIGLGASVHDIGKIAVPAEVLARPGRLSPNEFEMVKTHCQVGNDILGDTGLPPQIADIVLHHHERLDGSGYPDHLAGKQISIAARIVAVADVFDAMVSHRPYRPAAGRAAALAELRAGSGIRYDPDVIAAALRVIPPGGPPLRSDKDGSQRDELAVIRDERAALRDELAALREQTAELRTQLAATRDTVGATRDDAQATREAAGAAASKAAAAGDQAAEQRDLAADDRDRHARQLEAAAGSGTVADACGRAEKARRQAADNRRQASQDRKAAAAGRAHADLDRARSSDNRRQSATDRAHNTADRDRTAADRNAAAGERLLTELDRDWSSADRDAAATDRNEPPPARPASPRRALPNPRTAGTASKQPKDAARRK